MPRVVHFEIHAEKPERAIKFYTDVFGWTFTKWGDIGYWMIVTGPDGTMGINGGLVLRHGPPPAEGQAVNAYTCSIDVASVDEYFAKSLTAGGTVAVPKMPVPTVGWLAYVKDTEGNILGLFQPDSSAK
jgi:predicted enzyme related to lactoylglutathione lyase